MMKNLLLTIVGGCWLLYGLGLLAQGLNDQDVLVMRSGTWQVISGGLILLAAA